MPFSGGGHFGKIWPHLSVIAEKPQGKRQPRWHHSTTPPSTGYLKPPQAHRCLSSHPETKPRPPEGLESAPPTSGQASAPPIRKPTASPHTNFSHKGGQTPEEREATTLLSAKRTPHQKPIKMKRQRTITQIREKEKTPERSS